MALIFTIPLRADTVSLKSGQKLDNVMLVNISGTSVTIQLPNGTSMTFERSSVKSIRRQPVNWTQPVKIETPTTNRVQPEKTPDKNLPVEQTKRADRTLSPFLKSAILPGWGQYSEGRKPSGIVYAGTMLAAFQRYWTYKSRLAAAENDYNDPLPTGLVVAQTLTGAISIPGAIAVNVVYLNEKEKSARSLRKQGNQMAALMAATWSWNMIDIVYGGPPWTIRGFKPSAHDSVVQIGLGLQRDSVFVAARVPL